MEAEIVLLSGGTPRLGLLSVALNLGAIVCGGERRGASWLASPAIHFYYTVEFSYYQPLSSFRDENTTKGRNIVVAVNLRRNFNSEVFIPSRDTKR